MSWHDFAAAWVLSGFLIAILTMLGMSKDSAVWSFALVLVLMPFLWPVFLVVAFYVARPEKSR